MENESLFERLLVLLDDRSMTNASSTHWTMNSKKLVVDCQTANAHLTSCYSSLLFSWKADTTTLFFSRKCLL
jgi:hypothetical protein